MITPTELSMVLGNIDPAFVNEAAEEDNAVPVMPKKAAFWRPLFAGGGLAACLLLGLFAGFALKRFPETTPTVTPEGSSSLFYTVPDTTEQPTVGSAVTPPQMVYFSTKQDVADFLALLTKSEEEVESALDGTNIAFNGVSTLFDVHRVVARLLRCPRFLGDDDSFVMIYYTDGKYLTVDYYMDTMRLSYFVRAGTNLAGKAEQCPYAATITIDGKDIDLYKTDSGNYVGEYLDGAYLCSLAIYDCDDPTAVDYDRFLGWQDFPDGYTDPDET